MSTARQGIVYVATKKDRYVAEAFLSAVSAKMLMPAIPITLFTNLPESIFASSACFDQVLPIATTEDYDRTWSEGQLDRIRCLPRSPYEYTLHLDCDTRVRSADLGKAFELLGRREIAMVECAVDNSYSRMHYGRPMFNVGFILYRKSEGVLRLLDRWAELTAEHFAVARDAEVPDVEALAHIEDPELRRKLLFMDQLSMVQLLSPDVNVLDLDLEILDESYNWRGSNKGRPTPQNLKLDHHPHLRKKFFVSDLIAAARVMHGSGRTELGLGILGWAASEWPDQPEILKNLIALHVMDNDLDAAEHAITALLQGFPGYSWAIAARSKLAELRGSSQA